MTGDKRTKAELIADADRLHQRIAELEASAADSEQRFDVLMADQDRLRRLYENAPLGYQSLDADGNLLSVNPAWLSVMGYAREEVIGKWFGDFLDSHYQEAFRHRFPCFKQEGAIDGVEFEMLRKDGATVTIMFNGRIGYNVDGSFMQTHCIMQDVTDRKRAEKEIIDLAKFPSENPHPVLRVASDGQIIYANAGGEVMLREQHAQDPTQAPDSWMDVLADVLSSNQPGELEELAGDRIFNLVFAPVVGSGYVNIYGHDITERKRGEDERHTLEAQIQHAQKLESLGVLAGGIAHDFNNLLMAILGNADLALMDLSPVSPVRENLMEIKRASQRAAELARQMLAYSGKGKFVIEALSLPEIVEEMAHILEVSISKKAVLKYNYAENLPLFEGDATQVRQIIMNLITNASESIGDRSGVISVTVGAMQADRTYLRETYLDENLPEGLYVTLEVADTGCGMDEETRAKLFDPFFTTKFTGRGLGMAAVLGIVRGHSGAIKIYSEVGKGTTMKVLLPSVEGATAVRAKRAEAVADWHGSGTVLLVDDEETVRAIAAMMLGRLGLSVILASDGREAVDIYTQRGDEIDCVILDLTMPHMDGEQAFRELRCIDPEVRVIMSSGYNEQDVTQRFVGKGLAGFIQKPYELEKLVETLRGELGQ
ncbi:MAG: response regulator [Phycisphaerae bacterium]|jgi:PAS domain S-box-containing protein|nr:response regulator [Phycisphaerae bacterium]